MKDKIERFAKGDFEYELPLLCLSEDEITLTAQAGKIHEGSFAISNSAERSMQISIYSSNGFMELKEVVIQDATNIILYQFNAANLEIGDEIQGDFNIITEFGEVILPFTVSIEAPYCMSSLGKIKDLFQFTNLARMDWSDAKRVFRSEDFESVFLRNEPRFQFVYRNLLKSISMSQALEEFLVTIRKKAAIQLEVDRTHLEYQVSKEQLSDKLTLTKNQWGYAEIRVSTDASFIQLEQKFLWSDRFIGNSHQITYLIDPGQLRHGNNYGHIWIKTAHQNIEVTVVCKCKRLEHRNASRRHLQRIECGLMETYLDFRLNRIGIAEYLDDTEALIEKLPGPEVSFVRDLMRTHLAVVAGRDKLAEDLLSDFAKDEVILKKRSIPEYCGYLYLEALHRKDEEVTRQAAENIRRFYSNGYSDWRILWFLLYLDKRYEQNKAVKLADIKEQFEMGCRSPILYYEAVCIINEEPYLLRELTDFEIQVLNFGIRNWMVSRDTAKQYTYLSGKRKAFDQIIFNGLVKLYDEFEGIDILSAVCCTLIKGLKKSHKYFEWYRLGVEAQLRITELYEYYVYCADESMQDRLAQQVLLYFIFNSSLNDSKKAYLYAAVVKNKSVYEEIYHSYQKKLEVYALIMLERQEINRDLAILYQDLLKKPVVNPKMYEYLPYVLYRHEIILNNPSIVNVIVVHKELGVEENVSLIEGKAQVDIYSGNSEIILVDSFGNRYVDSMDYELVPLLNAEEYETVCMEHTDHPMLLLHLLDYCEHNRIMSADSMKLREKVLKIEGLSPEYQSNCTQTLIEYYYDNLNDELLENYLGLINLDWVWTKGRSKYIEIMLIRAYYVKALQAMEVYGYEGIAINRLVKLCSVWLKTEAAEQKQSFMVKLCYHVFLHNKYDEAILSYLIQYYQGAIEEMYRLWQAAQGFELDCHYLEERILIQMLFTQSLMEFSYPVFSSYYKSVTNHMLNRAYLSYQAYQYLVNDGDLEEELVQIMKRELFYEENDLTLLAWLKYHSFEPNLSEHDLTFAEYNLNKLVRKEIILPFFLNYQKVLSLPNRIKDKLILSCQSDTGKRIFIHYRLGREGNSVSHSEQMNHSIAGIFTKEFLLFHHEELQYDITVETEEGIETLQSEEIRYEVNTIDQDESNYNRINRMLQSLEDKDDNTLLELMEGYARKEYMISQCFQPLGQSTY